MVEVAEHADRLQLLVGDDVVQVRDEAVGDLVAGEAFAPLGEVPLCEVGIEQGDELGHVLGPLRRGAEALVRDEVAAVQGEAEAFPFPILLDDAQLDQAVVPGAVVELAEVQRPFARPLLVELRSDQLGLDGAGVGPCPCREERGGDVGADTRPFPLQQAGEHGREESDARRVVTGAAAERSQMAVDRRERRDESGAGPVADLVVAGLLRLRPGVPVAGAVGEDEPWIHLAEPIPGHAQVVQHRVVAVRQEDVGGLDQTVRHLLAALLLQVDDDALLVPAVEQEAVGNLRVGHSGEILEVAVDVAPAGPLDLDHLGAEIGEDGAGRRGHDDRRQFHDTNPVEQRRIGVQARGGLAGYGVPGRSRVCSQSGGHCDIARDTIPPMIEVAAG